MSILGPYMVPLTGPSIGSAPQGAPSMLAFAPDAWYDPSDFSTMFKDHAGTDPVTALEQTVALMLDKSRGLVRGAEKIIDPEFDDPTKWQISATSPATATMTGGKVTLVSPAGENASVIQVSGSGNATIGRLYEFTLDVESYTGTAGVHFSGAGNVTIPAGTGIKRVMMFADGLQPGIKRAAACNIVVRSMSVKEIPGNHVGMTTAGARPAVSARVNLLENSDLHTGIVVGTIGSGGAFPTGLTQSSIAGITRQVLGFGTLSDGRKYFDLRVSGTNTSGSTGFMDLYFTDGNPLLAAAVNSQFTAGLTVHYTAGSTTTGFSNANRNMFVAEFNGGTFLTSSTVATAGATGTPTRFTVSRTFNNASVTNARMALDLTVTTGGTIDLTIRVIEPQLEYGTVASRFQRFVSTSNYDSAGFPIGLRFDGVDDGLFTPYLTGAAFPFTMVCAAKSTGVGLGGVFGLWGGAPPYYEIQKHTTINQWRAFDRGATNYLNAETVAQGTTNVLTMEMTATTVNLRVDGTDPTAATAQDNAIGTLTDIRIGNGGSGFFSGMWFGGVLKFGATTDQRNMMERLLANSAQVTM